MYGGSNTDNTFNNVVDRAGSRKRITQRKVTHNERVRE